MSRVLFSCEIPSSSRRWVILCCKFKDYTIDTFSFWISLIKFLLFSSKHNNSQPLLVLMLALAAAAYMSEMSCLYMTSKISCVKMWALFSFSEIVQHMFYPPSEIVNILQGLHFYCQTVEADHLLWWKTVYPDPRCFNIRLGLSWYQIFISSLCWHQFVFNFITTDWYNERSQGA